MRTPLCERLGLLHPIIQGGMSWASSDAALPLAVSRAGGLGVIAAGPMYPDALREAVRAVAAGTDRPFAVNVPLSAKHATDALDIALAEHAPVVIGSQGSPAPHLARCHDAGVAWLQVVASVEHAEKAERAGVDAVIAVGAEAGGHPGPDEVGTLVLVRAVVTAVGIPVVGAGGIADGAGIAAMLCLGAQAAQLGTRFLLTQEAAVHASYKARVLAARTSDTTLVDRGHRPLRMLKNHFTAAWDAACASGSGRDELDALLAQSSLRIAARDGDVDWGKVEAGQSAGLVDDLPSAFDLVQRLAAELDAARARVSEVA